MNRLTLVPLKALSRLAESITDFVMDAPPPSLPPRNVQKMEWASGMKNVGESGRDAGVQERPEDSTLTDQIRREYYDRARFLRENVSRVHAHALLGDKRGAVPEEITCLGDAVARYVKEQVLPEVRKLDEGAGKLLEARLPEIPAIVGRTAKSAHYARARLEFSGIPDAAGAHYERCAGRLKADLEALDKYMRSRGRRIEGVESLRTSIHNREQFRAGVAKIVSSGHIPHVKDVPDALMAASTMFYCNPDPVRGYVRAGVCELAWKSFEFDDRLTFDLSTPLESGGESLRGSSRVGNVGIRYSSRVLDEVRAVVLHSVEML